MFKLAQGRVSMGSHAQVEETWLELLGIYRELGVHYPLERLIFKVLKGDLSISNTDRT